MKQNGRVLALTELNYWSFRTGDVKASLTSKIADLRSSPGLCSALFKNNIIL